MRHPTDGMLRRLLDEPAGVADSDRQHVAGCSRCLSGLAIIGEDAAIVETSLSTEAAVDVDVDAAWRRLSAAATATAPGPQLANVPARAGRARPILRRPTVAACAVAVVLTGAGVAAANDWLPIFRTERIAPLSLSTSELNSLPDLGAFGDVVLTGDGDVHSVPDARAATAETGLAVPEVTTLPRGVTGEPLYQVGGEVSATFTFSTDRTVEAAAEAGTTLPLPPPGLDGTQVRLVAGPGLAEIWSRTTGVPSLVVGRAVAPTASSSSDVPFEALRDYLLSLSGLNDDVAAQLRAFNADGSTLPLPVPGDFVETDSAQVDGVPATVLATRDRTMAAVVWVDAGVVTAVAGSLDVDEVLSIARELR